MPVHRHSRALQWERNAFSWSPANVESLKRVVASPYALVCLGSRIWRDLACVKSSKKVAESMALIDSHEIIWKSRIARQGGKWRNVSRLTKIEVLRWPLICKHDRFLSPKTLPKCTNPIDASLDMVPSQYVISKHYVLPYLGLKCGQSILKR
jgi:hypothetical protein